MTAANKTHKRQTLALKNEEPIQHKDYDEDDAVVNEGVECRASPMPF